MKTDSNATIDIFFEPVETIKTVHLDQQYDSTDECIGRVYLSYDYSRFCNYEENRSPDHYRKIEENMKLNGAYDTPILTVLEPETRKLMIADGGNTFEARKNLGLPIPYVVFQGDGRQLMKALNVTRKNWARQNYIHFYSAQGFNEYEKAERFMKLYPDFPRSALVDVLAQSYSGGAATTTLGRIKAGTLEIEDYDWSIWFMDQLRGLLSVEPAGRNIVRSAKFMKTLLRIVQYHPDFDFLHLRDKIETFPTHFYPCVDCAEYAKMIEALFNYHQPKRGVRIDLHNIPWGDKGATHPKASLHKNNEQN